MSPLLSVARRLGRLYQQAEVNGTADEVGHTELGLDSPEYEHYESSGWFSLRRGLRGRPVTRDDVFIDFGCGKGRVLRQAARQPFARVIGVDINERMAALARANLEADEAARRCRETDVVVSNMASEPIPDDVTVAYLFNSVKGAAFSALIERIEESLDRRPRRLTLIYAQPVMHGALIRSGRFRRTRATRVLRRRSRIWVYDAR
jgi:SAM-dependent methyltransferase